MSTSNHCSQCGNPLPAGELRCTVCVAPPGQVSTQPLRVGEVLEGKWRLEGKLGAGGMGAVFLAKDIALGRKVAVKVLAQQLCNDREFVTRFEREARATAQLEHPNIVPVHAVGWHNGRPFIVMKALEGVTLSKLLRARMVESRKLSREEILDLFRQLCAGLGFLHARGYVHRDIKTSNVFVAADFHVTLLDFGVLRDATAKRITRSGVLLGTPTYVAPEQFLGASEVDGRADLYSVGVMLFECLAGRQPFSGDLIALMKAHTDTPAPDLRLLVPELPAAVAGVVRKALAKKPEDRFATAEALWTALEAAWPRSARPAVPADAAATLPAVPFQALFAPPSPREPSDREPTQLANLAAEQEPDAQSRATLEEDSPGATLSPVTKALRPSVVAAVPSVAQVKQASPPKFATAEWEMVLARSGVRRGRQVLAAILGVVAAVLAGVGAWYFWGRSLGR